MKSKTTTIIVTILFILYLLISPIIYKWYIDNGYNDFGSALATISVAMIGIYAVIFSWIREEN